jgi:uncharacterized cupin superfamily protein
VHDRAVIAHWDEVEPRRSAKGEMDAEWQRLGNAAGTVGVGVNRIRIAPGKLSTPPHSHGASEEIFHVLGGSGLSWQDEQVYEVRPGDTIVHLANHEEHTLRAGDGGLDVIVFGTRHPIEVAWLPRSRAIRLGWPWVQGRDDDPWDVEAEQPPLEFAAPSPRPANIVNLDDVPIEDDVDGESSKGLAAAAGSVQTGLNWVRVEPGLAPTPAHCHSEEEEVIVILEGEATLELWPSPRAASWGAQREDHAVRAGHVIARPPATRIAHAVRAGENGVTYLVYGTRKPNDIAYYPRSNKINFRGVGVIGRIEHLDYWDGEPRD